MALSAPTTFFIPVDSPASSLQSSRPHRFFNPPLPLPDARHPPRTARIAAASASGTTHGIQEIRKEDEENDEKSSSKPSISNWKDFACLVSGEWDGYGAEFSNEGIPIELPEAVVPQAFRDWEVQVFDWQTQCPTLAETMMPTLTYKVIKLLPTVGCEADAATRYSVEERIVGGVTSGVSAFAYDRGGSFVAVWKLKDTNGGRILELEHSLVDPRDRENRMRIIQVLKVDGTTMELQNIKVFSENWYGPFRNGEQLGGCAIRESGFASSGALDESKVLGAWQGTSIAASFQSSPTDSIHELIDDRPQKRIRDQQGLVTLPKQLWCSLKEMKDWETWAEVGWLLEHGRAMTSSCIFSKGSLKKIVIGLEASDLEGL